LRVRCVIVVAAAAAAAAAIPLARPTIARTYKLGHSGPVGRETGHRRPLRRQPASRAHRSSHPNTRRQNATLAYITSGGARSRMSWTFTPSTSSLHFLLLLAPPPIGQVRPLQMSDFWPVLLLEPLQTGVGFRLTNREAREPASLV